MRSVRRRCERVLTLDGLPPIRLKAYRRDAASRCLSGPLSGTDRCRPCTAPRRAPRLQTASRQCSCGCSEPPTRSSGNGTSGSWCSAQRRQPLRWPSMPTSRQITQALRRRGPGARGRGAARVSSIRIRAEAQSGNSTATWASVLVVSVRGESARTARKTCNGTRAVAVPRGHAASWSPPGPCGG